MAIYPDMEGWDHMPPGIRVGRGMVLGACGFIILVMLASIFKPGVAPDLSDKPCPVRNMHQVVNPAPDQEGKNNAPGITLNLVGDILLAARVAEVIDEKGADYPWHGVRDILAAADITLGNLECAVGEGNYQPVPDKEYTFLAPPRALAGAVNAGIDVLTMANNHILDFGPEAMLETIRQLENNNISYTGAGPNLPRASEPVLITANGVTVGVLAYSYVFPSGSWVAGGKKAGLASGYNYSQVYDSVEKLSQQTDLTVVSLHWGREMADRPSREQQELARQLVDRGAHIVLGHHPHVLQGVEQYRHGIIAYSTGNFIFTLSRDTRGRQSMILQVEATGEGISSARVIPAWIEYGHTVPAGEEQSRAIIHRLQALSREMGTEISDDGEISLQ